MTKVRVLKEGGFSGKKYQPGQTVNVKSTLVDALVKDGRAELVDEQPAAKPRASARGAGRTARGGAAPRGRRAT
jgi:hypothetical protein